MSDFSEDKFEREKKEGNICKNYDLSLLLGVGRVWFKPEP